jgi:hypothetical protein
MVNPSLFFWKTNLSEERQVEINTWYKSLTPEEKLYVEDLRYERYEEGYYDGSYLE